MSEGADMIMNSISSIPVGWLLISTGVAGLFALLFIILLFAIGQPFGTLNDISIGVTAMLSGILIWLLNPRLLSPSPPYDSMILLLATFGVVIVLIGSYRAAFGISGWYLSGLYMSAGNALIGIWLFYFNLIALQSAAWQSGLSILGIVSSGVLLLGLAAIPGMARGIDIKKYDVTIVNVIWWTSALGWLVLYPIWCLLLGITILK
ncbi:MAG: hypothetical protein K0M69_01170 [Youngiibacter sp.]|nr:hypothetical protein [Youngiibacter sp.]